MGSEQLSAKEVGEDGGEEGQDVDVLSPGIEEKTGEKKEDVSQMPGG